MRGGTRAHAAKGEELHFLWRTLEGNIIIRSIFFFISCVFREFRETTERSRGSSAAEAANDCIPTALLRGVRMSVVKMTEGSVQVESCGAPLFYRKSEPSTGDARMSVLLLHGIRFSSENWLSIGSLETLAKAGCCAVAIDLPELGRSKSAKAPAAVGELAPAGFLKEVCEKLNLVPVVVISPSLSGMYSLPFLLEDQALVRAYIPVAPICTEKFTAEQYQSVKVPTLIVYGDQDTQLGEVSLRNLMNLADHSVVVMKGAGHPCYLDDPDTWHKVLTDFLNRL